MATTTEGSGTSGSLLQSTLVNIASGPKQARPPQSLTAPVSFRDTIQAFEKKSQENGEKRPVTSRKRITEPLGKSYGRLISKNAPSASAKELAVHVSVIETADVGYFKLTPSTTFKELRALIAQKLGHSNFGFQDATTKRPFQREDQAVLASKTPITIAQSGIDNLLADATIQEPSNTTMTREGGAAFKVFWWDSLQNTRHSVWLKFEPHRITVNSLGGSFKLFDANGMRTQLVFAGVKGSDKGFQLIKGGTRLASRFFAQSAEQKSLISIFFCFVWRPNAVRRGWLQRLDLDSAALEHANDATDPRQFVNLLRRHMIEIDKIIHELERNMDSKLVRYYIALFSQMFTGGYVLREGDMTAPLKNNELQAFGKVSKLMEEWQEKSRRNRTDHDDGDRNKADGNAPQQQRQANASRENAIDFDDFFGEYSDPFELVANLSQLDKMAPPPPPMIGADGVPAPPPPPAPAMLKMKQAICAINFEGISGADIKGTIWAEFGGVSMKATELNRLENQLKILFGKDARERTVVKDEGNADGVLEKVRVQNLEVLLAMEGLKGLSPDELVDMILNYDNRIFCPAVLERLVRHVSGKKPGEKSVDKTVEKEKMYAGLPSQLESQALQAHYEKHGAESLRTGELFFLNLTTRVSDRMQRFEFGYFMSKFENEAQEIEATVALIIAADKAIRGCDRFKNALKIVLDILTTLMPRYGTTKGFRISSFCDSTDRVHGTVANPKDDTGASEVSEAESSLAPYLDPSLPEAQRKRLLKLATLRSKKVVVKEADFWKVKLQEYMTVYLNRFEVCQGFWTELLEPCSQAMSVDQAALDTLSGDWLVQLEVITMWFKDKDTKAHTASSNNRFYQIVETFLNKNSSRIVDLRERIKAARSQTEALWKWLGEVMVPGEPGLIFKYVHTFCDLFAKQWKALEQDWDHRRTLVLRGQLALKRAPPPSSADTPKKRTVTSPKIKRSPDTGKITSQPEEQVAASSNPTGASLSAHKASDDTPPPPNSKKPKVTKKSKKKPAVEVISEGLAN